MNTLLELFQNVGQVAPCAPKSNILGVFPTWYKYLEGQVINDPTLGEQCIPKVAALSDVWLIVAAVTDMLLRIAVLIAIGFVVVGGAKYISSQGMPDKTAQARDTIIKAVIGLVISLGAATILTFVVGNL